MMTLEEMKKRKKELGYSNQRIADLSGISFGTVQKIFGGYTETPRYETLLKLEKALSHPRVVYSYEDRTSDEDIVVLREPTHYGSAVKKEPLYTIDDYYALPDDQRMELIDGVFYDMASPSMAHQIISGRLFLLLSECIRANQSDCHVVYAPIDVQLDKDAFTMVQPDIILFCGMDDVQKDKYYGAPKFVVEILSPSTRSKDMYKKLLKYREAGVREYWIIDPKNQQILVHQFSDDEDAFTFPALYGFDDKIPLGVSEGKCVIDFAQIHEAVKPFLDQE